MALSNYSARLLNLAKTFHCWLGQLAALDLQKKERVATYAEKIAATLNRAAAALSRVHQSPADETALYQALHELGRISGYLDTFIGSLEHHLDGRKLGGVKRRLEQLDADGLAEILVSRRAVMRLEKLAAAEGYFKALADGLRT